MAKIVINKNFQSKYLYRAYERLVKPDYDITTNSPSMYWNRGGYGTYDPNESATLAHSPISIYNDLSSTYKTTWQGVDVFWDGESTGKKHLVPHQYFLCDETFLTLLNKINKTAKSGMSAFPKTVNSFAGNVTVTGTNRTANLNIMLLVGSLFSPKKQVRDYAIDYFVSGAFITADEGTQIKNILSTFRLVDNNYTVDNYGVTYVPKTTDITSAYNNNVLDMTVNKVLRLDNPYKQSTENISNQTLYVLVIPYCDTKFIDGNKSKYTGYDTTLSDMNVLVNNAQSGNGLWESTNSKVLTGYNTFHNKATNTVVNQIPYIALSLTETGLGGDIEYDHLDEIEYLDEIKISIVLPKEYV